MSLSEDIYAKLQATAAVTAVFGTRTFPRRLPESVDYPAVRWNTVGSQPGHTHGGLISPRPRLVQFDVFDTDSKRGEAAAAVLIEALVGRSTWNNHDTSCLLASEASDPDPAVRSLYRNRVDLSIRSSA